MSFLTLRHARRVIDLDSILQAMLIHRRPGNGRGGRGRRGERQGGEAGGPGEPTG